MAAPTIGIVSAGAMGSAVGAAYAAGGARAVTSVQGRSERTRALAAAAGLELLAGLDEVVRLSDIVLSIVPPEQARAVAGDIAAAARHADADPLVADLNAVAPATVQAMSALYAGSGLDLVDGSISGGPPRPGGSTRLYLSGARAAELADLDAPGLDARLVGDTVGLASAVKMSTASVYKGAVGLLAHALLAAHANGVLTHVLDDLQASFPELRRGRPARSAGRRRRRGATWGDARDRRGPVGSGVAARALRRLRRRLRRPGRDALSRGRARSRSAPTSGSRSSSPPSPRQVQAESARKARDEARDRAPGGGRRPRPRPRSTRARLIAEPPGSAAARGGNRAGAGSTSGEPRRRRRDARAASEARILPPR